MFQFDGTDWVETDELRAPDAFSFELFGDAVAVSGTDVFVGARRDRNSNGPEAGAVYDFEITPVEPAAKTFIGVGSFASWNDPSNWTGNSVPLSTDDVVIPVGTSPFLSGPGAGVAASIELSGSLLVGADLTVGSGVEVDEGATLGLGSNGSLSIAGELSVADTATLRFDIGTEFDQVGLVSVGGPFERNGRLAVGSFDSAYLDSTPYEVITCAVDCSTGAFDSYQISPYDVLLQPTTVTLQLLSNKVVSPEPATAEAFGAEQAVAVAGQVMIVGAGDNDDVRPGFGTAYAYVRQADGSWQFDAELPVADTAGIRFVGAAVAVAKDPIEDHYVAVLGSDGSPGVNDGQAFLFERVLGSWNSLGAIAGDGGESDSDFGRAVDVDARGNGEFTVVVGAADDVNGQQGGPGAAYVFDVASGTVTPLARLVGSIATTAPLGERTAQFGTRVGVDGQTVVVSANRSDGPAPLAGAVSVFRADDASLSTWTEEAILTPCGVDDGGTGAALTSCAGSDLFLLGTDLAIDGDTVVAGRLDPSGGAFDVGANVYRRSPAGTWALLDELTWPGSADVILRVAVDVEGGAIALGASGSPDATDSGEVRVYREITANTFTLVDTFAAPDAEPLDRFGGAVALSEAGYVAVGARNGDAPDVIDAGAVYSYDVDVTPAPPAINTFIGAGVASWADPANWSSGSVPVIGEPAIVPAGTTAEVPAGAYFVGALTLGGRLQMASGGTDTTLLLGAGSVIEPTGVLAFNGSFTCFDATDPSCPSDNRLTIGGDLVVDGLLAVSATTTGSDTVFSKSIPTVVLADDTSVTGDGSLFLAVPLTKSGPGTSTIGPDLDVELFGEPPRPAEDRGVLQVDEGTLDIQSAAPNGSFLPNGTIDVAPGASVSVAEDLALSPTSELGFGIDGPASSTDNFGQLQVAALTSAGTLRTTLTGYTPAFDDLYPLIACSSCTSDPVTAFDTVDIAPFTLARSADTVAVRGPELPVDLTFSLDRTSAASVRVGSSAIPVTELDRTAVVAAGGTASNVAASSVTLVGSEENAIADIELKDTLIADAILASPVLRSIPLVSIDITSEGGWSAIVAGVSELAREPLTSLTLGQVLAAGVIDDPASPAGRVGALPLGADRRRGHAIGRDPPRSRSRSERPIGCDSAR